MTDLSDRHLNHFRSLLNEPDVETSRYKMIRKLGEGGMGTVWLAQDKRLGRQVAVKVISVANESVEFTRRLETEAKVMAGLEHPGIVPVYDVGYLGDGRVYYTMKHVQGERLDHWLSNAPSIMKRLNLFVRICEPVGYAHAAGIVHRDLKPENIMVGAFGELQVMDWGVARVTAEQPAGEAASLRSAPPGQTAAGAVIGTPGYMAPEQEAGSAEIDHRADIFALGRILRYLLTERASTPVPPPLEAIIAAATAERVDNRYPAVQPMIDDVQAWLASEPVSVYRETVVERLARFVKRNKFIVLLVCAFILARVILYFFR